MATTADFRNGLCIEFNGELFVIVEFQHVKPGKGPAFVRTKIRNLKTGRTLDNTFTAGVKIDIARVERRPYQFCLWSWRKHSKRPGHAGRISSLQAGAPFWAPLHIKTIDWKQRKQAYLWNRARRCRKRAC